MSVQDTYVINDVIYKLLENGNADAAGTLLTSMFTMTEIIDSMNRVQQEFMLETGMIMTRTTIAGVVGTPRYALPVDSIRPRRLTWTDTTPVTSSLSQVDTWELDNGQPTWPYDLGTPLAWWENTLPQQMVGIAPTPANNGTIGLLYIALATTLGNGYGVNGYGSGGYGGVMFTVPDDWTPYILYGTLSELLSSDGPAFDPVRASYCRQRYEEGIELARIVLGGM